MLVRPSTILRIQYSGLIADLQHFDQKRSRNKYIHFLCNFPNYPSPNLFVTGFWIANYGFTIRFLKFKMADLI